MSELFVNAPTQNRDFIPRPLEGRSFPIVVAHWLAETRAASSADLWNNVIAAEERNICRAAYSQQMDERLKDKYTDPSILAGNDDTTVIADTDPEFCEWTQNLVVQLLDDGRIRLEDKEVHVCVTCDTAIALAEAPIQNACARCGSDVFCVKEQSALVASMTDQSEKRAAEISGTPLRTLCGPEVLVSKQRHLGVSLEHIGLPGQVIDPKIGIGLLALYAASSSSSQTVTVVAGASSAHKNIPQITAFLGRNMDDLPELKVKPVPRIPTKYMQHLVDTGVMSEKQMSDVYMTILPEVAIGMKRDISPETLDRYIFSRKNRMLQN